MNYMRNTQTGEIRAVAPDGPEFEGLKRQVSPNGLSPLWEQTGAHDAQATIARAEAGKTLETDLGEEQAVLDRERVTTPTFVDPAPWSNLTPAEIEIGLTPEDKREQLAEQTAGQSLAAALDAGTAAILGGQGAELIPDDVDTPAPSAAENAGVTPVDSGTTPKKAATKAAAKSSSSKASGSSSTSSSTPSSSTSSS